MSTNDCFANRTFTRCSILTTKNCKKCKFYKTIEKYKSDRAKYKEKEIAFLERHGITYRGE